MHTHGSARTTMAVSSLVTLPRLPSVLAMHSCLQEEAADGEPAGTGSGEAPVGSPAQQSSSHPTTKMAQFLSGMQPLGSGIHSPSKQLASPGRFASPRPRPNGAMAVMGGAREGGTASQGTSGPDTGADEGGDSEEGEGEEEDGEGDGEGEEGTDGQQQGGGKGGKRRRGNQAGSSTPSRPQRIRKPKQYLGEGPETTPTRSRRGSLPTTPASAGRRPVSGGWLEGGWDPCLPVLCVQEAGGVRSGTDRCAGAVHGSS